MNYTNPLDENIDIVWEKFNDATLIVIKEYFPNSNQIKHMTYFRKVDSALNF